MNPAKSRRAVRCCISTSEESETLVVRERPEQVDVGRSLSTSTTTVGSAVIVDDGTMLLVDNTTGVSTDAVTLEDIETEEVHGDGAGEVEVARVFRMENSGAWLMVPPTTGAMPECMGIAWMAMVYQSWLATAARMNE